MKEAALWNSANQGDKGVISSIQGDLIEYFPQVTFMGEKTKKHQTKMPHVLFSPVKPITSTR